MAAEPKDTLINALTRREHSVVELDRKLAQHHPDLLAAERLSLIRELTTLGYQSDDRFAEMLIRSRLLKGHGRRRIEAELQTHGIDPESVSLHFEEVEESEYDRAVQALAKWSRGKPSASREQAFRFLAGRGFQFSDATEAVKTIFG